MKTKCLDTLEWFIKKSQKDKWSLDYDKNMDVKTFGIIDIDEYDGYIFIPVLHGGKRVYGAVSI